MKPVEEADFDQDPFNDDPEALVTLGKQAVRERDQYKETALRLRQELKKAKEDFQEAKGLFMKSMDIHAEEEQGFRAEIAEIKVWHDQPILSRAVDRVTTPTAIGTAAVSLSVLMVVLGVLAQRWRRRRNLIDVEAVKREHDRKLAQRLEEIESGKSREVASILQAADVRIAEANKSVAELRETMKKMRPVTDEQIAVEGLVKKASERADSIRRTMSLDRQEEMLKESDRVLEVELSKLYKMEPSDGIS